MNISKIKDAQKLRVCYLFIARALDIGGVWVFEAVGNELHFRRLHLKSHAFYGRFKLLR